MKRGLMPCPACGSRRTIVRGSHRRRRYVAPDAVGRGHECQDCGHLFVSIQRVATARDLVELADAAGQ